jgi:hypothetical protein
MSKFCLTLICAPEMQEKLLDTLLLQVGDEVFTSMPTFSHGTAPAGLNAMEQVLGRAQAVQVQILVTAAEQAQLLQQLGLRFPGAGLRYWVTPVLTEGVIA